MIAALPPQSPAALIGRAEQTEFPRYGVYVKCGPWIRHPYWLCRVALIHPSLRIECVGFELRPEGRRWQVTGYQPGPEFCPPPPHRAAGGRAE